MFLDELTTFFANLLVKQEYTEPINIKVKFAEGTWYGIELTKGVGKNKGSVDGHEYFVCENKQGNNGLFVRIQRIRCRLNNHNKHLSLTNAYGNIMEEVYKPKLSCFLQKQPSFTRSRSAERKPGPREISRNTEYKGIDDDNPELQTSLHGQQNNSFLEDRPLSPMSVSRGVLAKYKKERERENFVMLLFALKIKNKKKKKEGPLEIGRSNYEGIKYEEPPQNRKRSFLEERPLTRSRSCTFKGNELDRISKKTGPRSHSKSKTTQNSPHPRHDKKRLSVTRSHGYVCISLFYLYYAYLIFLFD
ncbi:hypothetical protein RFI_15996 [Reticulomyxa filosa]|uniref:CAP-Gly domain-containing protein n=1 Tax=Reticulomyxa filosa TaxID=46433 RepID=X6N7B7_RETFI|nr:hypothetical protein RFI_15996 [Reticulomyxa filosa]|eukprot:ETO21207.1 hypothetical protein RFI_15996 [Reticulomyxa filosa]